MQGGRCERGSAHLACLLCGYDLKLLLPALAGLESHDASRLKARTHASRTKTTRIYMRHTKRETKKQNNRRRKIQIGSFFSLSLAHIIEEHTRGTRNYNRQDGKSRACAPCAGATAKRALKGLASRIRQVAGPSRGVGGAARPFASHPGRVVRTIRKNAEQELPTWKGEPGNHIGGRGKGGGRHSPLGLLSELGHVHEVIAGSHDSY